MSKCSVALRRRLPRFYNTYDVVSSEAHGVIVKL